MPDLREIAWASLSGLLAILCIEVPVWILTLLIDVVRHRRDGWDENDL